MTGSIRGRLAQLGCGYWGRNLARNFASLGALAAIADDNPATARSQAELHNVPVRSVEDILADQCIDSVAIATPAATHAALAKRCLEAGKHVFVEKPLALSIADAQSVIAAAEKARRTLMVGHLLHYHPAFLALRDMVRGGQLGRLQYLYSNRLNLGKLRREENVFWSFAPHDISMILALVGEEPHAVEAVGSTHLQPGIADVTTTHLRFAGGIAAHVFVSWLHPFKEQKLVVVGDRGMAVFDDREPWATKLQLYPHEIRWQGAMPEPVKAEATPLPLAEAEPLKLECAHFLECVASGQTPRTDGHEGLRVLRVLDAAQKSMDGSGKGQGRSSGNADRVFVHETALIDDGVELGDGSKVWHFSHVLKGSVIGENCSIGQNVMIGPDVTIGRNCKVQNNVSLYKGVTLEEGVFCGPSCVFTNVDTPRAEIERKSEFAATPVGRGATIGANATIVCGHELGEFCFIGAGAVVTRDVPPFALMVGNPAKQIGWVGHAGERLIQMDDYLICPRTSQRYQEDNGRLRSLQQPDSTQIPAMDTAP